MYPIGILGLKINHLATLIQRAVFKRGAKLRTVFNMSLPRTWHRGVNFEPLVEVGVTKLICEKFAQNKAHAIFRQN
jgi:hypothetical protein